MSWYYDNGFELREGNPELVGFERVYCIRLHLFREEQWNELKNIYDELPGTRYEKGVPYWFGIDENTSPYLWVSVEPPGLQVSGVLPLNDWREWDEAFRKRVEASSLPIYEA
jgi:hypothetical protein